ncbi:MAG: hypothetical protein LBD67_07510 [Candidatus Accumulibacter sp.]|nr:hypothetical protein [Accumulibacter sp.]
MSRKSLSALSLSNHQQRLSPFVLSLSKHERTLRFSNPYLRQVFFDTFRTWRNECMENMNGS